MCSSSETNLTICFGAACSLNKKHSSVQESNAENDFANKYKLYRNAKTRKQHAAYDALMTSNNLVSDFALT